MARKKIKYPRHCKKCAKKTIYLRKIDHVRRRLVYGREQVQLLKDLPIEECVKCGEQWFTLGEPDETPVCGKK